MTEQEDICWKQRCQNFEKAYCRLKESVEQPNLTELEQNGLVQRFEFTSELAWKVMKDYLESRGLEFKKTPRDTFRQAQRSDISTLCTGLDRRGGYSK